MLKIPYLFGPHGQGIHGQVLADSLLSGLSAYFSVRYFAKARSLTLFAIYYLAAGLASLIYLVIR